jgi:plasmid stability protein
MNLACNYAEAMKSIQIRNVPDAVHRRLKVRAADMGLSLSELLLAEVVRHATLPTADEMRERLRTRKRVRLSESAARALRKERDST